MLMCEQQNYYCKNSSCIDCRGGRVGALLGANLVWMEVSHVDVSTELEVRISYYLVWLLDSCPIGIRTNQCTLTMVSQKHQRFQDSAFFFHKVYRILLTFSIKVFVVYHQRDRWDGNVWRTETSGGLVVFFREINRERTSMGPSSQNSAGHRFLWVLVGHN